MSELDSVKNALDRAGFSSYNCISQKQKTKIKGQHILGDHYGLQIQINVKDDSVYNISGHVHVMFRILYQNVDINLDSLNQPLYFYVDDQIHYHMEIDQKIKWWSVFPLSHIILNKDDSLFQEYINLFKANYFPVISEKMKEIKQQTDIVSYKRKLYETIQYRKIQTNGIQERNLMVMDIQMDKTQMLYVQ